MLFDTNTNAQLIWLRFNHTLSVCVSVCACAAVCMAACSLLLSDHSIHLPISFVHIRNGHLQCESIETISHLLRFTKGIACK